jgi:hypothetical protein
MSRIILTLSILAVRSTALSATITVDAKGGADFTEIQSALDTAADGDTVLVRPGEHVIDAPIDFNRLRSSIDPSAPVRDIVLRSEAGPEATSIRMSASPADPGRATVLVFRNGESGRSVLDGFTITGGKGTLPPSWDRTLAGGISCENGSSPVIRGCVVTGNAAARGGGLYCYESSSPALDDCSITGNSAEDEGGGGVWIREDCSPTFRRCSISRNLGGGMSAGDASSPVLEDCIISENASMAEGGPGAGISLGNSAPTFLRSTISGNSGPGIFGHSPGAGPTLIDCVVYGNGSEGFISMGSTRPISLTNCAIWGNRAAFACAGSPPSAVNCTVSGNGIACAGAGDGPSFRNCILWPEPACGVLSHCLTDRDPLFVKDGVFDFDRRKTVKFGDLERQMPDFVGEAPDFRLRPGSPAIDSGTSEGAPATDIEDRDRPCGTGIDIGAWESCPETSGRFIRGDTDGNGRLELTDAVALLGHLFLGAPGPGCPDAADSDDSGTLDLTDAVYSLTFQFLGGLPPPAPFPDCGSDGTPDTLDCAAGCP